MDLAFFFNMTGAHNDINMLHRFPVFASPAEGNGALESYDVIGHKYTKGFLLS
jgi:hypothetical protein